MIYFPAITAAAILSSRKTDSPLHGAVSASDHWPSITQTPLNHELLRREASFRTCGYRRGLVRRPITCSGTSVCVTDAFFGYAGCCDPEEIETCRPATTCMPIEFSTNCNEECQSDSMTLKCFESLSTKCKTIYYDYQSTAFTELYCGKTTHSVTAFPTYGPKDLSGVHEIIPATVALPAGSPISSIIIDSDDELDRGDENEEDDKDDRLGNNDGTNEDGVAAGSNANTTVDLDTENSSEDSDSGNESNMGAILGGVLGGIAVLGLLAASFFYLMLRHRRQRKRSELAASEVDNVVGPGGAGAAEPKEPQPELSVQRRSEEDLHETHDTTESRHPAMKDGQEVYEAP